MRSYQTILLLGAAVTTVSAAEPSRPRGVGPEFARFYKSAESFTCISNPSIKLPPSQVNDDFCDCPDGSDEPGTAACSYLSPLSPPTPHNNADLNTNTTLALPGFYCKNKGHVPTYVPFTIVNDGICDYDVCCDGSDEYARAGGVKCPDKCGEIGAEYRKAEETRQKSMANALRKKKEYIADAARLKQELRDQIVDLEAQITASDVKIKQLEQEKDEVEKRESLKMTKKTGSGGKAGVLAGLTKEKISELKNALTDIKEQRDTYNARLSEVEAILSTFKDEYNPNFNDEGVKRAVRSWEDYSARDHADLSDGDREASYQTLLSSEDTIDWEDFERGDESEESDLNTIFGLTAYLPVSLQEYLTTSLTSLRATLVANGILAHRPSSSSDSSDGPSILENKAVQEATTRLNSARNDASNQQRSKTEKEEDLTKDYGTDDIFRALKDKCIELDSGEYTYELCWLSRISQKSKKGGAHANNHMGNYVRFDKVMVDEEVRADGTGLGKGERVALRYENGASCWNGPNRSVLVVLACAEEEKVWKVQEEEKCVYRMEVGTPAVCEAGGSVGTEGQEGKGLGRDEL